MMAGRWDATVTVTRGGQRLGSKQLPVVADIMIERIIDWCASNRFLVFTGTVVLTVWGIWAMTHTPLDAVPDISDVQVIVSTGVDGPKPRSHRRSDHLSRSCRR